MELLEFIAVVIIIVAPACHEYCTIFTIIQVCIINLIIEGETDGSDEGPGVVVHLLRHLQQGEMSVLFDILHRP